MTRPAPSPSFHLMAKPTGARCNGACDYCFFLKKESLYPGSSFRMPDAVMEAYIRQTLETNAAAEVSISWQGGEPTLMGLDFFRRTIEVEKQCARPGQRILNTIQTNGLLIDAAWCRFFHEHGFLVGLSLDGPRRFHDAYRRDRAGRSVFDRVVRAARLMQEHAVAFNVLCTVNAANSGSPLEVYRFFRDDLGVRFVQFIPIVERQNGTATGAGTAVTPATVDPAQYGRFLIEIFDEWVRRDVGSMFVTFFDSVLASYLYGESSLCALRRECGDALVLEHTGDLYSCDHFVEPPFLLGNILRTPLRDLVLSEKQRAFGRAKSEALPRACLECGFLFTCHGECPKNRILAAPDSEPGLNWLCPGLKAFFSHSERPMRIMANLVGRGFEAAEVMDVLALEEGRRPRGRENSKPGRNEPCPCGSGLKFKKCHGRS